MVGKELVWLPGSELCLGREYLEKGKVRRQQMDLCVMQVAKMSVDPTIVELTADDVSYNGMIKKMKEASFCHRSFICFSHVFIIFGIINIFHNCRMFHVLRMRLALTEACLKRLTQMSSQAIYRSHISRLSFMSLRSLKILFFKF